MYIHGIAEDKWLPGWILTAALMAGSSLVVGLAWLVGRG